METLHEKGKSRFLEHLVIITAFSSFILPPVGITGNFNLRIDDILVLALFPLLFFLRPKVYKNKILLTLFFSLVWIVISAWSGYLFHDIPVSIRDLNEIVRLSKPLIFVLLMFQCDTTYILEKLKRIMPALSVVLILIGFIQYFNIAGFGVKLASMYSTPRHVEGMLSANRRIMITGSDPNTGAAIVMVFILYNMFASVIYRNFKSIILTLLLVILLLMTSSRTAFLALGATVVMFLLFSKSVKRKYKILLAVAIVITVFPLYDKFRYIAEGLAQLLEGRNRSLLIRFERWGDAMEGFWAAPLIGTGPAKEAYTTIVDGEYFLLLRRYGIIGTLLIGLTVFGMPLWSGRTKNRKDHSLIILKITVTYYLVTIALVMLTNSFFSGYQLLLPFVFFSAVVYKENRCRLELPT